MNYGLHFQWLTGCGLSRYITFKRIVLYSINYTGRKWVEYDQFSESIKRQEESTGEPEAPAEDDVVIDPVGPNEGTPEDEDPVDDVVEEPNVEIEVSFNRTF